MIKEIIFLVEEAPEGGYRVKALEYSIFTEAKTFTKLKAMVKDAVQCHFALGESRPSSVCTS